MYIPGVLLCKKLVIFPDGKQRGISCLFFFFLTEMLKKTVHKSISLENIGSPQE